MQKTVSFGNLRLNDRKGAEGMDELDVQGGNNGRAYEGRGNPAGPWMNNNNYAMLNTTSNNQSHAYSMSQPFDNRSVSQSVFQRGASMQDQRMKPDFSRSDNIPRNNQNNNISPTEDWKSNVISGGDPKMALPPVPPPSTRNFDGRITNDPAQDIFVQAAVSGTGINRSFQTKTITFDPNPSEGTPNALVLGSLSKYKSRTQIPLDDDAYNEGTRKVVQFMHNSWVDQTLCDVIIFTDGGDIMAHQTVLGAYSPTLASLFRQNPSGPGTLQHTAQINMSDYPRETVSDVINFLYTTDIQLDCKTIGPVVSCARQLDLTVVVQICEDYLVDTCDADNIILHYSVAANNDLTEIKDRFQNIIAQGFNEIYKHKHFPFLPIDRLVAILTSSVLCSSELDIFYAIVKWTDFSRMERLPYARQLLSYVRFQLIDPEVLATQVQVVEWIFDSEGREQVLEAYKFHALHCMQSPIAAAMPVSQIRCSSPPPTAMSMNAQPMPIAPQGMSATRTNSQYSPISFSMTPGYGVQHVVMSTVQSPAMSPPMSVTMPQPMSQSMSQPMSQSMSQPMAQSMSQPMAQSMSQPMAQSMSQPMAQSMSQPMTQSMSQLMAQSMSQPMAQSMSQPMSQSMTQLMTPVTPPNSLNQSMGQAMRQTSPNQSMGQAMQQTSPNQSMGQATQQTSPNQSMTQAMRQTSPNQSMGQAIQQTSPNQSMGQAMQQTSPNQSMTQAMRQTSPNQSMGQAMQQTSPNQSMTNRSFQMAGSIQQRPSQNNPTQSGSGFNFT